MRLETDALGEMEIPDDAYYGIQTTRTAANYAVSPHTYGEYMEIVRAVAEVKKACAMTNEEIGALDPRKSRAIQQAADEVIAGKFDGQFPVNVWRSQGTGVNMNVNEVIGNRANEILTGKKGREEIHPNTHVNMCQSSNDVFPTAENIVIYKGIGLVSDSLRHLEETLGGKAFEFRDTVRLGRTGLQDAVPMTWGQVFGGWQSEIQRARKALEAYRPVFQGVVLGGTVLGTGMGQQPGYSERIYGNLSRVLGYDVHPVAMEREVIPDSALFDGMRNTDHHASLMDLLKAAATAMGRIANDLMIFSSGPSAGIRELFLPEVARGRSGIRAKPRPGCRRWCSKPRRRWSAQPSWRSSRRTRGSRTTGP
ncbi:MAG: lyase family protein [Sutterellaceae bacterium]|nr:lyase family protein [Sutterellaceae bacterium]MDD7441758.1 lyase family protein [Sutterellaceae bacterium]MDY2868542.1 lyase family protein [Mesosutterella sp.]